MNEEGGGLASCKVLMTAVSAVTRAEQPPPKAAGPPRKRTAAVKLDSTCRSAAGFDEAKKK